MAGMAINVKDIKPPRKIKPRVPFWYDNARLAKSAVVVIAALFLIGLAIAAYVLQGQPSLISPETARPQEPEPAITELARFTSCQDIANTLRSFQETREQNIAVPGVFERPAFAPGLGAGGGEDTSASLDYSRTNVQVEGVDEADMVKTDGTYIYVLTQQQQLHIIKAVPPEQAKKLSTIIFQENSYPQEFFVYGKKLLVFGQKFIAQDPLPGFPGQELESRSLIFPPSFSVTFVEMYSIENPLVPKFERTLEFEGNYLTSRKIGAYVYFVLNSYPDTMIFSSPEEGDIDAGLIVPRYRDTLKASGGPFSPSVSCNQVAKLDPFTSAQFLSVISLRIDDPGVAPMVEVVAGAGDKVYASAHNLYVASPYFEYSRPLRLELIGFPVFQRQDTIINKFTLDGLSVVFGGQGRVPGTVLNQFSMDENEEFFRIATTVGELFNETPPKNNIYVLDEGLKIVGSVENLAPGETIYSARFVGKRAYLVTFKKIDPFFVIDLSEPQNPKVLGALKIPGFSDYLHPLDENHIIGIGKNAAEDESGTFAWFQGMKLALFDVTNSQDPKELHKIEIGDRGTDSPALTNHKAFFFDAQRHILALPILLAQLPPEAKEQAEEDGFLYGDYIFQGSYVWRVTSEQGFVFLGRVTHLTDGMSLAPYYATDESDFFVYRNVRIGGNLYSISDGKIVINNIENLVQVGEVSLTE